jgi:two-component system CheB/CheR fusion protein
MTLTDAETRASGTAGLNASAIALATAAVYFGAAKLGFTMAVVAEQVTVVWPPSGLALVAVLLIGTRSTLLGVAVPLGVALGAFLANVTTSAPFATALGISVGNTLEAVLGAWLLTRAGFSPALDRLRDVLALVLFAAVGSTAVSATIGVGSLCLGAVHPWQEFGRLWWEWWVGDALGDLVAAPVLLVWATVQPVLRPSERRGEAIALVVAALVVGSVVFSGRHAAPIASYPLHYTVFPLVIWSALRFGQRGTATMTFLIASVAIWGTVRGSGPFAMNTADESLIMLQLFMAVVAVTGLVMGAAITERDVARRRAAREYEHLQISEERLRLALDAGNMGVWDWNIATSEVKWSDNLEAIHGLYRGAFPETFEGFQALVHPDDRELVDSAVRRAVEAGTGYEVEFRNIRSDGRTGWMSGKGRVLRDGEGRPARMLGVAMDVTERRALAEELGLRARELADAGRRKDEFLAMLSHELRNPLGALSTALKLLEADGSVPAPVLALAERQVQHLVRLVDDLMDVSRITQGKIVLCKQAVALDEVVDRALEMVRPLLDSRGHAFQLAFPPGRVQLDADPGRLAQVLANLLGNAAKYTPPGGSIALAAERVEGVVSIRVRDSGPGIAPELLPHVFDLFVQGNRSLDRAQGGLGIGLTIVRRLVELHDGRVEVRSFGRGAGSEFVVHLPVSSSCPDARVTPQARGTTSEGRAGGRVLVVEDNPDACLILTTLIERWGFEVRVAADGVEALEVVRQWLPDAIVSDIGLPGMHGYELARELRRRPELASTMLIALSGYGREDDRRLALDAGFDHHFSKPPDFDRLAELLTGLAPRAA